MTDAQLAALISALTALAGAIGAVVKWAVGRYEAAEKARAEREALQTARIELSLNNNTSAMLESARAAARLEVKVDSVADWAERHTPIYGSPAYIGVGDFIDPSSLQEPTPPPRPPLQRSTPRAGVPIQTTYGPKKGG